MDALKNKYCDIIREKARGLGFDDCGFARAEALTEERGRLKQWLDAGMHGDMHYMANHFEKRLDPSMLVEGARTVVVLLTNYFPKEKPKHEDAPILAKYAYGEDYHYVLKEKLKALFAFIKAEIYPDLEGRCFVDSAPVLERALAVKAGLGWIGKNAHLINKRLGSYVFISELIVNLALPTEASVKEACGTCTRCIDACPTNAIVAPRTIDSRRCISYLTIENKGDIPEEFADKMQNRVYGCDICQEACPWTRKSSPHTTAKLFPNSNILDFSKKDWQALTPEDYLREFEKSPVKRAGYGGLRRNIDFLSLKKDS